MIKTTALSAVGTAAIILLAAAGSAAADAFSINASLATPDGVQSVIGSGIAPPPPPNPYTSARTIAAGIPGAAVTVGYSVVGGLGFFGSSSSASALAPGASIIGVANAISDETFDNLKIIPLNPSEAPGTPVNYSINFDFGGSLVSAAFGSSSASASVELSYLTAPGTGVTLGTAIDSTIPGDSGASGIFSEGVGLAKRQTPVETGFVGHDVYAEFILGTHASVDAGPSASTHGQASASADFLDPFSFPTDGPVFNFFDANGNPLTGVTVDSSDGCIVNNVFMCGSESTPGSVPELSTWTMMLAGFAGLSYAGWRRGRRQAAAAIGEEIGL